MSEEEKIESEKNSNNVKNFGVRSDEETVAQFKRIAENFDSSGACFKALLNTYEMQLAKKNLSGYQISIDDFETHAQALIKSYIHSLDINVNTEERVRKDLQDELNSKDEKIAKLKEEYDNAVKTSNNALKELNLFKEENKALRKEIVDKKKQINDKNEQLVEEKQLNKTLRNNCDMLETQINSINSAIIEVNQLKTELKALKEEKQSIEKSFESKLLEAERKHLEAERVLEGKHKSELEEYQQRIKELLTVTKAASTHSSNPNNPNKSPKKST